MPLPLTDLGSLADAVLSVLREPVGWAAIAGGLVRLVGSILTSRTSARSAAAEGKRVAEIETKRIDANLAAAAMAGMQSFIVDLQADVTELRRELRSEREQRSAANDKLAEAESRLRAGLDEIHLLRRQLEEAVSRLKPGDETRPPPAD